MPRTLRDLNVQGRTVFVRVDFNVPLTRTGEIADDARIVAAMPTLRLLRERRAARLVVASHLGRPKGRDPQLSLRPIAARLAELLDSPVELLPFDLDNARSTVVGSAEGAVLMLENTRYYDGEEENDPELAGRFAALADVYVNDAFGAAHRAHSSTEGVARLLPSAAGLLLERETAVLAGLLEAPKRPFIAVLGGAKVSDKISVIESLLDRVDALLIGGAMANTFALAQGLEVGKSLVERDQTETALDLVNGAYGSKLVLPVDYVVLESLEPEAAPATVARDSVKPEVAIYDVGPETVRIYKDYIRGAATVFWNGPVGMFEDERCAAGTAAIAHAVAESKGYTVVGGGDSIAALNSVGCADRIDHVSTGGGASLEFLEGKTLPCVQVLEESHA